MLGEAVFAEHAHRYYLSQVDDTAAVFTNSGAAPWPPEAGPPARASRVRRGDNDTGDVSAIRGQNESAISAWIRSGGRGSLSLARSLANREAAWVRASNSVTASIS